MKDHAQKIIELSNNQKLIHDKEVMFKNVSNYDTIGLNKSIEANNFFKNEEFSSPIKKVYTIHPNIERNIKKKIPNEKNNKIDFDQKNYFESVYKDKNNNDLLQPTGK